jgi:osmoprotectant transport system permease protein
MVARAIGADARRAEGGGLSMDVLHWLTDPANWTGPTGIPERVAQHLWMSFLAMVIAALIAIPVGLWVGHRRRFERLAVWVAYIGRAIPSFAVLVIVFILMVNLIPSIAFGTGPTVVALVLLAIPSMLVNTYVGIQGVDADIVEAARGMGLRERQVLFGLEGPLAAPLIMAGVRVAALQVVATATLAALIGGGGLGRFIVDGFAQQDNPMLISGAILVAGLALLTEGALYLVERWVRPRTASRSA